MNKHGFYEGAKCLRCGVELQGFGSGRPAEAYAGTYNGLCYPCTNNPKVLLATNTLDGAKMWSLSPAQPSWRRDREVCIAYDDCTDCGGNGFNWVSKPHSRYRSYCESCHRKYDSHPSRVEILENVRAFYNELMAKSNTIAWNMGAAIGLNMTWLRPKGHKHKHLKAVANWEDLISENKEFFDSLKPVAERAIQLDRAFRAIQPKFWAWQVPTETLTFSERLYLT